jgi:hypothetical protein
VNFNGTGTVAIRASGNVSSITDNGVGSYTINFTTALPDANYSVVGSCDAIGGNTVQLNGSSTTGTSLLTRAGTTAADSNLVCIAIFR